MYSINPQHRHFQNVHTASHSYEVHDTCAVKPRKAPSHFCGKHSNIQQKQVQKTKNNNRLKEQLARFIYKIVIHIHSKHTKKSLLSI